VASSPLTEVLALACGAEVVTAVSTHLMGELIACCTRPSIQIENYFFLRPDRSPPFGRLLGTGSVDVLGLVLGRGRRFRLRIRQFSGKLLALIVGGLICLFHPFLKRQIMFIIGVYWSPGIPWPAVWLP